MSRFHLVDSMSGEVVGQYSYKPSSRHSRTYRHRTRRPLLERFLATHEGHIVLGLLLGLLIGLWMHP